MDEDNNLPGSSGTNNGQPNQQSQYGRVRRPSASIISSTTPMFQAPQNPPRGARHSQNFGPGDIDDDLPQASSSSSLRGRLSAGVGGSSSNNRPQSPLGSPDSTAYWGHSASPATPHSYRAPLTPGSQCIVSSSTSDDIPQSPFSPDELGGNNSNHGFPQPSIAAPSTRSVVEANVEYNNNTVSFGQSGRRRPSLATSAAASSLNLSSNINNNGQRGSSGNENRDLNASSASPVLPYISPLRNKIKKASSFERFSQAQAAIISNSSNSNNNSGESSISSLPPTPISSVATNSTSNNPSVSVAGPSRTIWDSSPNPSNEPSTRSFNLGDKFHIKIPSKKLAAKIASVYEQEKLNEQLNATLAEETAAAGAKRQGTSSSTVIATTLSQNDQMQTPPSTLAQILNQQTSSSNSSSIHNILTDESIINQEVNDNLIMRELTPLNLTDTNNSNVASSIPLRNPVISSRTSTASSNTKKIPLTPKQKLLHRLQSGELLASLSPPPQPIVTTAGQIPQQTQHHLSVPIMQQQQQQNAPVVSLYQSLALGGGSEHLHSSNVPSHSPTQQQLDQYSYESLLRSRDDFVVQDPSLGKGDDPNVVSNMLSVYDPDTYSYYSYQNILGDEIFTGGSNNSRQLLMMPNAMDQQQPIEFVLGLSSAGVDDGDSRDGSGRDELQLVGSAEANEALNNVMKSHSQTTDSTLRNLLMMEPLRNNHTSNDDGSWLDYQRLSNIDTISSISRGNNNIRSNGISLGGNLGLCNSNSWTNDTWPARTSSSCWQSPHPSSTVINMGGAIPGDQDQDEVMDMSMMDNTKAPSLSHQMKRLQMHMQSSEIEEIDLTTGLPILSHISNVNMPIDLQQQISIIPHKDANLPMDLQQHRMDIDDEPVNLMAVNTDQDQQELASHHHQYLNQAHLEQQNNKGMISQNNSSYALQIQTHHSPELQTGISDLNGGSSGGTQDVIDERRIIRVKKNKDSMMNENNYQVAIEEPQHVNIIMDKPVQPKSIASLPSPFRLSRIDHGNELAVFNNMTSSIPSNCRLGPVEGPLRKATGEISNMNAQYPSLVMAGEENTLWQLDRSDDEFCNWMKFVRLAHSIKDQNALVVESDGYLYFMTCKEILSNAELQVGYSYEYAQKYGLPILLPMDAFIDPHQDNRLTAKDNSSLSISIKPVPTASTSLSMIQGENEDENVEDPGEIESTREEEPSSPSEVRNITIETYPCFECDQEFAVVEELQSHINTHKDTEIIRKPKKKAMKKFQNDPLQLPTTSTSNLSLMKNDDQSHQKMSADSSSNTINTNVESACSSVQDQVCLVEVGKQQDNSVTTGVGQPAPTPKVKCTMCYKSFANKERLEKHMIVHSDEDTKPLKCSFCTKRFLTNSALAGHIKTHAEEGKFFECPMCNFSTPQLLQLKEHVQSHKSRETGLFYCPKCPKKFSAYSMVRKHIRAFHGPRQFTCDQCPMSFPTSDKLKLHQLKHSDHREFLCAECGKQFKRKDKLREHTKRIHETKKKSIEINIPKDKNSKKFIPKVAPEEYHKFPFKCQDCMVGFKRRGMLVNHLAKRHPEKKIKSIPELNQPILRLTRNYPCLYCDRIYKSSSKRKAHILKAHPGRAVPPQLRGTGTVSSTIEAMNFIPTVTDARNLGIGTLVQTVTEDGMEPRSGIMNVSCNPEVSTTSGIRKEGSIVGKVAALPHACQWCYREYATRAKLLQHQRKVHISLMPQEMQTPRTQKNNVAKGKKDRTATSEADASPSNKLSVRKERKHVEASLIIPDSTSTTSTTSSTIQTIASVGEGLSDGNVIGYLLTSDLSNLMPSELVMFGDGGAAILTSQAPHGNSNQNITIIASSSNSSSNNIKINNA